MTVLAFDATRRDNGTLMADCHELGYLLSPVLDVTFGLGRFWTLVKPQGLIAFDIDARRNVPIADMMALPIRSGSVGSVVIDPPYRLSGTPTTAGEGGMDDRYGVTIWRSPPQITAMYDGAIGEAARVLRDGGVVLVKCADQINGGKLRKQTRDVIDSCEAAGFEFTDELFVVGGRAQPKGTRQVHARRNYSTLIVATKKAVPVRRCSHDEPTLWGAARGADGDDRDGGHGVAGAVVVGLRRPSAGAGHRDTDDAHLGADAYAVRWPDA